MASKPCDQLDVHPWDARDATSEKGTSGFGMDPGYALQVVDPQALTETSPERGGSLFEIRTVQFMEASETSQQAPKGSKMGSQVPIAIHRNLSEYTEVMELRVARRAIQQFCRENVLLHTGQVITSEAQLAVIFNLSPSSLALSFPRCVLFFFS